MKTVAILGVSGNVDGTLHAVAQLMAGGFRVVLLCTASEQVRITAACQPGNPFVDDAAILELRNLADDGFEAARDAVGTLRPDCLLSLTEFRMTLAAALRAELGLPGASPVLEQRVSSKWATRQCLRRQGLTRVTQAIVPLDQMRRYLLTVDAARLPLIIKPDALSGSIGVHRLDAVSPDSVNHLIDHLHADPMTRDSRYVVESCMEGPEISVEGVCIRGRPRIHAITDKTTSGPPHFIETGHQMPSRHSDDLPALETYLEQVMAALDYDSSGFHAELMHHRGAWDLVETHTRFGGDFIPLLVELAGGGTLYTDLVTALLGGTPAPPPRSVVALRHTAVEFFSMTRGRYGGIDLPDLSAIRYRLPLSPAGGDIQPRHHAEQRVAAVVLQGRDAAHLAAQRRNLRAASRIRCLPS